MQLAAFDIKAGHVGRPSRDNDRAIIFLGQALQPFASVHGIAYGRDDLRARRSHGTDNGLAEMDADSDPNRLRQVPSHSNDAAAAASYPLSLHDPHRPRPQR